MHAKSKISKCHSSVGGEHLSCMNHACVGKGRESTPDYAICTAMQAPGWTWKSKQKSDQGSNCYLCVGEGPNEGFKKPV